MHLTSMRQVLFKFSFHSIHFFIPALAPLPFLLPQSLLFSLHKGGWFQNFVHQFVPSSSTQPAVWSKLKGELDHVNNAQWMILSTKSIKLYQKHVFVKIILALGWSHNVRHGVKLNAITSTCILSPECMGCTWTYEILRSTVVLLK